MTLKHARWFYSDGVFPCLGLTFDQGRTAFATTQQKSFILNQDIVCLDTVDESQWTTDLPPVSIDAGGHTIRPSGGCVRDSQLAKLARDMIAAVRNGQFEPQDIAI